MRSHSLAKISLFDGYNNNSRPFVLLQENSPHCCRINLTQKGIGVEQAHMHWAI
jgi:hypothetical protein